MDDDTTNTSAKLGDKIDKNELKSTEQQLIDLARSLQPDIKRANDPKQLAALLKSNGDLLARARELINKDILFIAGEAKVSADQILAAIAASRAVIDKTASVKSKLAKIGAVLDFVAAILTGSGTKIFAAANQLKADLSKL